MQISFLLREPRVTNPPPPAWAAFSLESTMTDVAALKAANETRWAHVKVTRGPAFSAVAKRLVSTIVTSRYKAAAARTSVPWWVIAVIHERECSQDWHGSLAQGDPWDKVSVHVPAGRGPFASWEDAAIDALANCAPYAARNRDWSAGGTLTLLEQYNGLGYAARGRPSPYIWAGTNQYQSGKFVRDGVYDPDAVDGQLGCAGLLLAMMALDPSIAFPRKKPSVAERSPPQHAPPENVPKPSQPSIANPSKGSIGAFIANLIAALFRRK